MTTGRDARRRCWEVVTGEGPTVVVVHGMMDRSTSFARLAKALPEHRVVRYDRRGYARSLDLGPPASFDDQVDDLRAVLGDHGPALVFGHSYGGTIALATAARSPEGILGLLAYECPMPWLDWWPANSAGASAMAQASDPADASERFMRRMIGDDRWSRLPPSTRAARRAEGPTMIAELGQVRPPHGPAFDPADVRVPLTMAHGGGGAPHHAEAARTVAAGAPDGELVVVEDAGHGIHLSHPRRVAELLVALESRADSDRSGIAAGD